jgi:hypothetical protein
MEEWKNGILGKTGEKNRRNRGIVGLNVLYSLFQYSSAPIFVTLLAL